MILKFNMRKWFLALGVGIALAPLCAAARGEAVSETFGTAGNPTATHPGKLTMVREKDTTRLLADLAAIPAGAKVYHASLVALREEKGLEDRQDEWLQPVLVYALPATAAELPQEARPLDFEGPWYRSFDVTAAVARAVAARERQAAFLVRRFYRWMPERSELRVTYEGKAEGLPAQVTWVRVRHASGNTFVTWKETERLVRGDEITIGELVATRKTLAQQDKGRKVRYCVLRHSEPITAQNAGQATVLAEVEPLSCANPDGGMDHWNHPQEIQNRFVVDPREGELPWGTGLYVHTTRERGATFYYAVVTAVNGRANLRDFSSANAPADAVREAASRYPVPVLQLDKIAGKNEFGGVRDGARVRLYVTWNAEPFTNLPGMAYNWCVTIDEKQLASPAPVGLYLHEWAGTHVRTTWAWPGGRSAILVSGNDFPPQTWWYGWHEAKGTSRSWGSGKVHNYAERRVLAFLDWVAAQWPVDRNRVFVQGGSMGGAGAYTFALRNGERFAMVQGNVGIANWSVRGHFTTALELCTGYLNWTIPASDAPTVKERMNMAQWLREHPTVETPFLAAGNGKDDGAIGWEQAVTFFKALQETKRPHAVYWGLQGHGTPPPRMQIDAGRSQQFRLDQTLPAFTRCSLDDGIGTAAKRDKPRVVKVYNESRTDFFDGDSQGGFNLHLRWETDASLVKDQPELWEMTLLLVKDSPAEQCTVNVTPRRCRNFQPKPGEKLWWTNTSCAAGGKVIQSGAATVDRWGLVTVEGVTVSKGKNRISITRP